MRETSCTKFPSFMDGTRRLRRTMTANAARKRKLLEKFPQSRHVLTDRWIDLGVGSLQVRLGKDSRRSMTRPRHVNHIEIIFFDQPIRMYVEEAKTRIGNPNAPSSLFFVSSSFNGSSSRGLLRK
jgi:hypothetical protein